MVYCVQTLVWRWLCPLCCKTFRHLPPFLLPHKRFMNSSIIEIASKVLRKKQKSYASSVKNDEPNRTSIQYERGDGTVLSPSSSWRWIQCMALIMREVLSTNPESATEKGLLQSEKDHHKFCCGKANSESRYENLYRARWVFLNEILEFS